MNTEEKSYQSLPILVTQNSTGGLIQKTWLSNSNIQVKKLHPDAKLPERQTSGSAGYDLYSLNSGIVPTRSRLIVKTGIAIKLPPNTCGTIMSRSGLSVKSGIEKGAGLIDG